MISEGSACAAGRAQSHLSSLEGGHALTSGTAAAFQRLKMRAHAQGFDLSIASSWRGYERQLAIFNGKASGERSVHDDHGVTLSRAEFSDDEWLLRILRFSALPGASRHHWGTDLDIYDRNALKEGERLQLSPTEYGPGGPQHALASWLLELVWADDAEGFFLPYQVDHGGVAIEPWHISYRTEAQNYAQSVSVTVLEPFWRGEAGDRPLALLPQVMARRDALWARFVMRG